MIASMSYGDANQSSFSDLKNWVRVGSTYYGRKKNFDLEFDVSATQFSTANKALTFIGSPFAYDCVNTDNKSEIFILNAAGLMLANMTFSPGFISSMYWSHCENLIVFSEYSECIVYSINGSIVTSKILASGQKLSSCRFSTNSSGTYFTLLTVHKILFHCKFNLNIIEEICTISLKDWNLLPLCWDVVFPSCESTPVHIACQNSPFNSVVLFQGQGQFAPEIMNIDEHLFYNISKSFNHDYVSLVSQSNTLWICSYNLKKLFSKFDLTRFNKSHPSQLKWCGSGSVVCMWNTTLIMLGPANDFVLFSIDANSYIFTCMESLVILSYEKYETIIEISNKLETLYLTAMSHGAILYEAYNGYMQNSPYAMELIDSIKNHLVEAVDDLLGAALDEFSYERQKTLLDASLLGMAFYQAHDKEHFHKVCRTLQVLNNLQNPMIGIPLTYNQFNSFTLEHIIAMLERRGLYGFAYNVCKVLGTRNMLCQIISKWVIFKIESSALTDKEIEYLITEKLLAYPDIPLIDIGTFAIENNRKELALNLLAHSNSYVDQVPLLLKLNQVDKALVISLESGNVHLVYMAILYMKKNMSVSEFLLKVRSDPWLLGLCLKYYKEAKDEKMLESLYEQEDLNNYLVCLNLQLSMDLSPIERISYLNKVRPIVGAKSVLSKICDNYVSLYEIQKEIETNSNMRGSCSLGETAFETIHSLIKNGFIKEAESIQKKIGISTRQYHYILMYALAETGSWDILKRVSAEKTFVPLAYEVVNACIKHRIPKEVLGSMLDSIPIGDRCKAYLYMEKYERAAEAAIASKEARNIRLVMQKCQDKKVMDRLTNAYKLFN